MKPSAFEEKNDESWRELEKALDALDRRKPIEDAARVPRLFRQVCGDLALAQHRMYGRRLCERLNGLVIGAYQHLGAAARRGSGAFVRFFASTFPRAVRREKGVVWTCLALFFVPFFAFITAAYFEPKWIFALLPPEAQAQMDSMYGKENMDDFVHEKFGSSFAMFGFYIINNVSIHFRIFASGVLLGGGAIYGLGYQGIFLGAMFGYVHTSGNLHRLYTFCASHSSFELLGFILGAAAGVRIGLALVHPGRLPRAAAMREAGKRALPVLLGSTMMLVGAAVIEGFWSGSSVAAWMKHTVGILGWVLFTVYFTFAGRRSADEA